jgi:hypothetical protein
VKNIPLLPIASQSLYVSLDQQSCEISVYQKSTGVYLDLTMDGVAAATGILCRDRVRIIRYGGLSGDLMFADTQGASDPQHTGMGSRWLLVYLLPGEVSQWL